MGLEGVEERVKKMETIGDGPCQLLLPFSLPDLNCNLVFGLDGSTLDSGDQMQLLMQAQALLRKSELYQKIDESLQKTHVFQPNVYYNLPHDNVQDDDDQVYSLHRDTAVSNLRFLNIFYGYSPATYALAVNLLDRLLGKVKAHPKYLSCIATSCFCIAAKTLETEAYTPGPTELVKLSQCGGTASDLARMERLILDKLQWQLTAITPLTYLQLFYEVLADKEERMTTEPTVLNSLIAKLEVLLCQFEFTQYRAETLALALLSYWLQEKGVLNEPDHFGTVVELQYYCQITDCEFIQCRGMVMDYLNVYGNQRTKLPRLQLVWTVSRRTMAKLRPSTRCILDLEPIMEDEDGDEYSGNDAGPFDSENDDGDLPKIRKASGPSLRLTFKPEGQGSGRQKAAWVLNAPTTMTCLGDSSTAETSPVNETCKSFTSHSINEKETKKDDADDDQEADDVFDGGAANQDAPNQEN